MPASELETRLANAASTLSRRRTHAAAWSGLPADGAVFRDNNTGPSDALRAEHFVSSARQNL